MVSMKSSALEYFDLGLSVIPVFGILEDGSCSCGNPECRAKGKHPRYKWKAFTKKRASREQIIAWWDRFPESNIGIVTGSISGIAVIDVDGENGLSSLEEAGLPVSELPVTPSAITGGGGLHFIYRNPIQGVQTKAGVLPNVDIRGEGGYIIAPPSVHSSGSSYEWVEGRGLEDVPISDFDFSFLAENAPMEDRKKSHKRGDKWYEEFLLGVGEGERNDAVSRLAGRYFSLGMTEAEIVLLLEAWNLRNDPPISSAELKRTVESIKDLENSKDDEEDLLETISSILRVKLSSVKRITGDEPQIVLEFDEGTCILTTGQLLSPKFFQQAVAEATKVIIRKLSTKTNPTHDRLAQMIMLASEDVDAGLEATGSGELMILIGDFISNQRILELEGDIAPEHGNFEHEGIIWFSLGDLMQRSGARWGVRTPMKQLAQQLRAIDAERRVFNIEGGGQRIMWGIDKEKL